VSDTDTLAELLFEVDWPQFRWACAACHVTAKLLGVFSENEGWHRAWDFVYDIPPNEAEAVRCPVCKRALPYDEKWDTYSKINSSNAWEETIWDALHDEGG
jgi:hypothetical protein